MERSENYIIIYHNISQIGFELFMVMYLMVQVQAVKKKKHQQIPNISWPKRRLDLQYLHILVNFKALRVSSNMADVSLASTTGRGNRVKSPTGL